MTHRLIFLFLLSIQFSLGQTGVIHISGRVTDAEDPNIKMYGFIASARLNDTLAYEIKADSLGYYKFDITGKVPALDTIKISVRQDKDLMLKEFPKDKECPFFSFPNLYQTRDYRVISPVETDKNYVVDFVLQKYIIDFSISCLSFVKGKTKPKICGDDEPEIAFNYIKCLLQKNPTTIIEIRGRSWNENRSKHLSRKRARMIKDKLISEGFDKNRIEISALGDNHPVYSGETIKNENDGRKKMEMEDINRSVYFVILSFDHKPE